MVTPNLRAGRIAALFSIALSLAIAAPSVAAAKGKGKSSASRSVETPTGPEVTFSSFQVLPDGRSRIRVELTSETTVTASGQGRHLEFVFQGTRIPIRNNQNPLVTEHFSSSVLRAKFVVPESHKKSKKAKRKKPATPEPSPDARLLVELREAQAPSARIEKHPGGTATWIVEFPRPAHAPAPPPDPVAPKRKTAESAE